MNEQAQKGKDPKKEKGGKTISTVSTILGDGRLVETIFQRDRGTTGFVVSRDGDWLFERTIELASGERLIPISPGNNLLKHRAVLLAERPSEYGDEHALLAEIVAYLHRYVDLSPTFEKIAAHYILLTWVYDVFNELPYLRFRGEYGSGKTRALLTIGGICYKGFFASGASTVSPIFHVLDGFGGTLILDEADFRFSDEKSDLVKILNNGNVKGLPVLRTMASPDGKEFNPRAFSVFGPKIVASRGGFEDRALESRFITEDMGQRGMRDDIPINLPDVQGDEATALRNKLLLYRLRNRHLFYADETLVDPSLEHRFNQILVPLLSVSDDRGAQRDMQNYARKMQNDHIADRGQSVEGRVVELIARLMAESTEKTLAIGEVARHFIFDFGSEFDRTMTPRWMGFLLHRKLGLTTFRKGGVFYLSLNEPEKLSILFRRYGLAEDAATVSGH